MGHMTQVRELLKFEDLFKELQESLEKAVLKLIKDVKESSIRFEKEAEEVSHERGLSQTVQYLLGKADGLRIAAKKIDYHLLQEESDVSGRNSGSNHP